MTELQASCQMVNDVGARRHRSSVFWIDVVDDYGNFSWRNHDTKVRESLNQEINIFFTLKSVHDVFAPGSNKTTFTSTPPAPEYVEKYKQFVRNVVERYDGDGVRDAIFINGTRNIKHWQIENEPGIEPVGGSKFWNGTSSEYANLYVVAYQVIKKADPEAMVALPQIGRCSDPNPNNCPDGKTCGNACVPEGDVCHYKDNGGCPSNSVRNDCCGAPGNKGQYQLDSLGIPRCYGLTACVPSGGACASSADCCDGLPCLPDASGHLFCGATTCVPQGGVCTTTADCCTGLPCIVPPGSLQGICGETPPPPPPSDGGVDAKVSDGSVADRGVREQGTIPDRGGDKAIPDQALPTCALYFFACSRCSRGVGGKRRFRRSGSTTACQDQGSQYQSELFQRLLTDHGVTCSMSRQGDVWDNSAMESFFSSLKTERVHRRLYGTRDQARADVFDYIERFYNQRERWYRC